jgi:hypothetical protein
MSPPSTINFFFKSPLANEQNLFTNYYCFKQADYCIAKMWHKVKLTSKYKNNTIQTIDHMTLRHLGKTLNHIYVKHLKYMYSW